MSEYTYIILLELSLSHWTITMSTIPLKFGIKWINKRIDCFFYANADDHIYIMVVVVVVVAAVVEIWDGWFDMCHFHIRQHIWHVACKHNNIYFLRSSSSSNRISNSSIHSYVIYLDMVPEKVWGCVCVCLGLRGLNRILCIVTLWLNIEWSTYEFRNSLDKMMDFSCFFSFFCCGFGFGDSHFSFLFFSFFRLNSLKMAIKIVTQINKKCHHRTHARTHTHLHVR